VTPFALVKLLVHLYGYNDKETWCEQCAYTLTWMQAPTLSVRVETKPLPNHTKPHVCNETPQRPQTYTLMSETTD
jgi:hypothetical protein